MGQSFTTVPCSSCLTEVWLKDNKVSSFGTAISTKPKDCGEREVYLTPVAPGCGHIAAGAAEVHLWAQHVALSTRRIYNLKSGRNCRDLKRFARLGRPPLADLRGVRLIRNLSWYTFNSWLISPCSEFKLWRLKRVCETGEDGKTSQLERVFEQHLIDNRIWKTGQQGRNHRQNGSP